MAQANFSKASKKYDIPIYSAAWINSPTPITEDDAKDSLEKENKLSIVVGGGGGDRKHGIKNRLVVADYDFKSEELSDETFHLSTDEDPPFRIAVHPGGDYLVAAFEKGCKLFDVSTNEKEKLVPSKKGFATLEESGEQKFVLFSQDGTHLAVGGDDKRLRVLEWPSLKTVLDLESAHTQSLKDADFSLDGKLLATTADCGPLNVWDISSGKAIGSFSVKDGRLGLCRFGRDGRPILFTTCVKRGQGWVLAWNTETWSRVGARRIMNDPISGFGISRDGNFLGVGSAEGDLAIVNAKTLTVNQRVGEAHMVFITAVEFSPNSKAILSVSGDSSARVTKVDRIKPKSSGQFFLIIFLIILLGILMALKHHEQLQGFKEYRMIQETVTNFLGLNT